MDEATIARFAEIDGHIAETDRRLVTIARQSAALGEMVEVLGGYINAPDFQSQRDEVQRHVEDDH
ncbi:MAG TPA: hypothetical protein VLR26_10890 [Frankiaceae bacterium]|nr:hypothetical protein [Frankiaceae bacterium]